ncbi:ArsA family ATPase [Desulfoluna spongiiphila]|uniref:arsenite-transporting ATPase n=1 Tax=Desulfoluna spongiiphila TaxID=419481 RepID=A0A1G5CMM3_9BACT|nr:ArsA family ATPase [Desulfoluna spongiiphila]SCY03636.1 arsenite efflux ATP-binding protein ArsA [Desulfoluna spongiiphila]
MPFSIKPEYLHNFDLKLLFFGGKGGVGKTTLSAAAAISLAEARPTSRVLLLSTDPAHSLSDSLDMDVTHDMTPVPLNGQGNLFARQLCAETLANRFRERHGEILETIAERGTYFDREDISGFFALSMPGLDEVMAVLEVATLLAEGACDLLILDTAPTGHTLRLLALPEHMRTWIRVMDLMLHKHRYMASAFSGKKYAKDRCDRFLETLGRDIDAVGALFRDGRRTRFVPVMTPELMSFRETERLVQRLEVAHIPLREILVNRVDPPGKGGSRPGIFGEIKARFRRYGLVLVAKEGAEVKGIPALKAVGTRVGGEVCEPWPEAPVPWDKNKAPGGATGPILSGLCDSAVCRFLRYGVAADLEVIVVGGKGGVGKTTVAASLAVQLADCFKGKRVLIVSTDPAHSLSDAYHTPIGDRVTRITENLSAYEINADGLFERFKEGYRKEIQALFKRFAGRGMDIAFDREVMAELLSLAPSGLDEIMALDAVMDARGDGAHDILVLDGSPTGHLLRFLEMPGLVRAWLKAFFAVLRKYHGAVKLTATIERVLDLSRRVRRMQGVLQDRDKTAFVCVTLPESMVLAETDRLVASVAQAGISCRHLVVNRVTRQGELEAACARFPRLEVTEISEAQNDR